MAAKIGFIGAGRMAGAMIEGLIAKNVYSKDEIIACAPTEATRNRMTQKCGIKMYEKATDMVDLADVLVLAIKPKYIASLFKDEGVRLGRNHLLISIAAGVKLKALQSYAPESRIVRVMPNHCCMVLEGAAGFVMGEGCTESDRSTVNTVLSAIGLAAEVREEDLDAVTGICGSSPAYLYMAAHALIEAGMKYGLTEEQATVLAAQSMIGAGKMVLQSGMKTDALVDGVCSPGGTTIEGVKVLREEHFENAMIHCVDACVKRSIEMGKE
ncbi:MAG: pyrroline-5-carboxylate reductase [archaeon]|nr:pyrroline-5-carboxylate reductase [archaeon]